MYVTKESFLSKKLTFYFWTKGSNSGPLVQPNSYCLNKELLHTKHQSQFFYAETLAKKKERNSVHTYHSFLFYYFN